MKVLSSTTENEPWLKIGKLVAAKGLQGELRVHPNSDFPERFTKPGIRWLQAKSKPPYKVELISGRQLPGKLIFIVRFKGITDRSKAESIVGEDLLVPSNSRPTLDPGEFHFLDLIGLEARLQKEGPSIGEVTDLTKAGNDLLEIKLLTGRKVLIPFVKDIVPEVHLKERWLVITPPRGLLDL